MEGDKSKKILRILSELSHRIDENSTKCHRVEDLFSPNLLSLRSKLRECSGNAVKSEDQHLSGILDIGWRKGSYEVIHLAKKLKKGPEWTTTEAAFLKGHFLQSFGFYQYLLLNLRAGLDFDHQLNYGLLVEEEDKPQDRSQKKKAIFKCLMYMGDLTRYQLEFTSDDERERLQKIAKKYYMESLIVDPNHGQPFNQLAALSGNQCHGMIAVYFYLRCLTAKQKFEGAEGNMKIIFEKAANSTAKEKKMVNCMMILMQNLMFEESTKNLSQLCRQALEQVINSLYHDSHLSSQASTHAILSLLLVREKSSGNGKKEAAKVAMINAFLLAWFTHLTTKILADLHFHLFGPEAVMELFEEKKTEKNGVEEITNGHDQKSVEKKQPKKGDLRRRRRRATFGSDEDIDQSDNESENSEISDENDSDFENGNGNDEESDYSSDFIDDSDSDEDIIIEESKKIITVKQMMNLYQNHSMIEPFQLCCHWLKNSKEIIDQVGENSKILWTRLELLIETLSLESEKYENEEKLSFESENLDELKKMAFPEDKISRGMAIFETRHEKLDFEPSIHFKSDKIGLARLHQIEELKSWLFKLPSSQTNSKNSSNPELKFQVETEEQNSSEKTALMENMAQLWLQQEVRDLEDRHETKGKYSPYLVVDHAAMINHMFAIKDIVASKRFAVVVPNAVVQQLDGMKKTEGRARNAIKWLERQFQQGNRWLRGQKQHEFKALDEIQMPQKAGKNIRYFFKIMECCNYLIGNTGGVTSNTVTLITTTDGHDLDLIEMAKTAGIIVETVEGFLAKCKIPKKCWKKKLKENG